MSKPQNYRELEKSIHTDLEDRLTYSKYLHLADVLGAQHRLSDEHDEMLFIVIHQVYELWFKQLLHELDYCVALLGGDDGHRALHTLKRVLTILKVQVSQLDILETMTPLEFLSFRERLEAASGFQSHQFRQLEFMLGAKRPGVVERFPEGGEGRRALERRLRARRVFGLASRLASFAAGTRAASLSLGLVVAVARGRGVLAARRRPRDGELLHVQVAHRLELQAVLPLAQLEQGHLQRRRPGEGEIPGVPRRLVLVDGVQARRRVLQALPAAEKVGGDHRGGCAGRRQGHRGRIQGFDAGIDADFGGAVGGRNDLGWFRQGILVRLQF